MTKEELLSSKVITVRSTKFTRVIKKVGPEYFQMIGGKSVDADSTLEALNVWAKMPGVIIERA